MPTNKEPTDPSPTARDPSVESSTQSAPSTHRGLTPQAASTVGELPDSSVDHLSDTLDRVSAEIDLEIVDMPNVIELNSLQDQIKQVKKQLKELKKLRQKEKDEEAVVGFCFFLVISYVVLRISQSILSLIPQILSYSKVTFANLHDRLGVKAFEKEVKMNTFLTILDSVKRDYRNPTHIDRKAIVYKPNKWPHEELRQSLLFIEEHVVLRVRINSKRLFLFCARLMRT